MILFGRGEGEDAGAVQVLSSLCGCTKESSQPNSQLLLPLSSLQKHGRHDFFVFKGTIPDVLAFKTGNAAHK